MPLLQVEAEKLSNNLLERGVIEEIIESDEMFAMLPFKKITGKAYVYNREKTLGGGDWLSPVVDTVPESGSDFDEITAKLRILAGDVDVDKFLDGTMDDHNSQKAIQIAQKAKGIGRDFRFALAQGNSAVNAKQFDGIARLVDANQKISAGVNGNALSLDMLDELEDAVPNGCDAFIMPKATARAYRALMRTVPGGNEASTLMVKNFGRPMLAHNGIPIIVDDFLSVTEDQGTSVGNTTSIYAVRFNEVDGLHGIYGGSDAAGFVVEDIGTVQNKDSTRTRMKWYCGLVLKSTKSLACIHGVTNV